MAKNPPTQTQRIITALAASILVFYLWIFVYQKFFVKPQATPPATATAPATGPAGQGWPTTEPTPGAEASSSAAAPAAASGGLIVRGGEDTKPVTLGDASKGSQYPMALELTPRGAAAESAWVRGFFETVKREKPYRIFQPLKIEDRQAELYSLATIKVRFVNLDQEVALDSVVWKKESATPEQAVFSVTVQQANGSPLARIVKTFSVPPQPAKKGTYGETYDMSLTTRIENLTGSPLQAVLVQEGPLGFQSEARQEDRKIIGAIYEKSRGKEPLVKGHMRAELVKKDLVELGRDEDDRRVAWVAEANQYFTCIMAPFGRVSVDSPALVDRVDAIHLSKRSDGSSDDLTFRYVSAPITVAPGQAQGIAFDCYIGPKSKKIFESTQKYEQRNYYAVITEGFYACAPKALVAVMMGLLNGFHRVWPHNYGLAIILLVFVVRLILHPITKRSQVNMMKMQKQMSSLTPKINAAKEKYANDKAAMNQAVMEVYRDAGVNPAGSMLSCLPMMLQLPIWAALWAALNSTVEMRHAPFDGFWIKDLTQPDALIPFGTTFHIPLVGAVHALNVLPILLAVSQLLQAKYMPRSSAPSTSDNPDQMEQQRKMMMFMSVFFLFMFYNMPSGLNLYIMTSNVAGILEQWRIRQHVAEEEERLKHMPPGTKAPPSWLGQLFEPLLGTLRSKWDQLQKEAQDVKKLQSERPKKRK